MNNVELGLAELLELFEYEGHISPYCDEESLADSIELYLENCPEVKEHQVEEDTLFENPGYETGYIAASWIDNDGLHLETFQWEIF